MRATCVRRREWSPCPAAWRWGRPANRPPPVSLALLPRPTRRPRMCTPKRPCFCARLANRGARRQVTGHGGQSTWSSARLVAILLCWSLLGSYTPSQVPSPPHAQRTLPAACALAPRINRYPTQAPLPVATNPHAPAGTPGRLLPTPGEHNAAALFDDAPHLLCRTQPHTRAQVRGEPGSGERGARRARTRLHVCAERGVKHPAWYRARSREGGV